MSLKSFISKLPVLLLLSKNSEYILDRVFCQTYTWQLFSPALYLSLCVLWCGICTHACMFVWPTCAQRPEEDRRCTVLSLTTLLSPWDRLSHGTCSYSSVQQGPVSLFFLAASLTRGEFELRSSCLCGKCSYELTHLPFSGLYLPWWYLLKHTIQTFLWGPL